jgi:hypothetical protein
MTVSSKWSGTSNSSYLVLPGYIVQLMPNDWQERMEKLLNEAYEATKGEIKWPPTNSQVEVVLRHKKSGQFVSAQPIIDNKRGRIF